jgi:hypothetical protein
VEIKRDVQQLLDAKTSVISSWSLEDVMLVEDEIIRILVVAGLSLDDAVRLTRRAGEGNFDRGYSKGNEIGTAQ